LRSNRIINVLFELKTINKVAAEYGLQGSNCTKIDLSKDYAHIVHLASQYHMDAASLCQKNQIVQQQHKKQTWSNLCKEYPLLAEYEKIIGKSRLTLRR
jgi:hypothetical protein